MFKKSSNRLFILSISTTAAALSLTGCTLNSVDENTCENNTFQCSGKTLEKCIDNNWQTENTCKTENFCNVKKQRCDECEANSISCAEENGKSILTWCETGKKHTKECPDGCDQNACKNEEPPQISCENDDYQCSGVNLEKCVDGKWERQKACDTETLCNADKQRCDECEANSISCTEEDGKSILTWCETGKKHTKECPNGCDKNACKNEGPTQNACENNDYQCSGADLEKCVDGKWERQESCDSKALCNANQKRCDECSDDATSCTKVDGKSIYSWCENGKKQTMECKGGCDGNSCKSDLCPDNPDKTEPGICGCQFEDKDIDGDGNIDCPVKTIPDNALPELPNIEGKCAEWSYPKHPTIEYPKLPEYSYETTIDIAKYGISNVYDVSKAEETTRGLNKAIADAKNAGYTRIVIPDGHYPILVDFNHSETSALNPPNDVAIIMSKNVILQQIPTQGYDCNIINLRKKANIYIEGGQLIGERYDHILSKPTTNDEECNAITSYYSNHIFMNGLRIKSSHGDGILLYDQKDRETPSSNFIIANCEIDDVFRNGIAVVGVNGVRITNNEIHHTNGTAPQFAIDFEANSKSPGNTNAIVDHNYFHDNVAGDLIIDAYDTFIEYNRFSQGNMERYIDNPFIIRNNSSYIAYRNNFEKFTKSTGCGYAVCCSYATKYDPEVEQKYPSFFVENEITHTRLMLTRRNKVCVKKNTIHEGHMSASTIHQLRLIDNRVEHFTKDAVSGYYSFKGVFGTASGNMKCSAEDKCEEVTNLNAMTDDQEFNSGLNFF